MGRLWAFGLAAALVACGSLAEAPTLDAGAEASDEASLDGQPADVSATDVTLSDGAGDADADASLDATAEADAPADGSADAEATCTALLAQIDALGPALSACTPAAGCRTFEYPYCGSFGCFQTPLSAGADVSGLEALAHEASLAGCEGFHCGCQRVAPSFCLKGVCRQCPPDCDGTCDELSAALLTVAHAGNWCGTDSDCAVVGTGLCPVGDLPCGGLLLNGYADTTTVLAVVAGYGAACGASTCKCAVPGPAVCVQGKCVAR